MGRLFKKVFCLLTVCAVVIGTASVNAAALEDSTNILFIGNSLTYYYDMPDTLYHMAGEAGINARVISITESGTTLYRCASEETDIGKQVLEAINTGIYDYVVIQPSRRCTPYEQSVYDAEKAAAQKLNALAVEKGAKTLVFATPGLNTGILEIYSMDEDGLDSTLVAEKPITREEHYMYAMQTAENICADLQNAEIVYAGTAVESAMENGFVGEMYRSDNRHPTRICSYLFAACFFDKIFGSVVGNSYIGGSYAENVAFMQKIADITMLGANISTLNFNTYAREFSYAYLTAKNKVTLEWGENHEVQYYELYRKQYGESFQLAATLPAGTMKYVDTLSDSAKYYYKYRAVLKTGELEFCSEYSPTISISTLGASSLSSLKLKNKTTATLSYTAAQGAKGYKIYRRQGKSGDFSCIKTTSSLSYTDSTLITGKNYYYKVRAYCFSGGKYIYSAYSAEQSVSALAAPTLKLKAYKTAVRISYNKSAGAYGYMIYMRKGKTGSFSLCKLTSDESAKIYRLKSGTRYYFKVKAFCLISGKANYSRTRSAISIKTLKPKKTVTVK